jgi:hypothetical protein
MKKLTQKRIPSIIVAVAYGMKPGRLPSPRLSKLKVRDKFVGLKLRKTCATSLTRCKIELLRRRSSDIVVEGREFRLTSAVLLLG